VHGVAREEVLAPALVRRELAQVDEVEDRPDVAEERVLPLAGEDQPAAGASCVTALAASVR
jgi:hypothetical protein